MTLPDDPSRREMFLRLGLLFTGFVSMLLGVPILGYVLSPVSTRPEGGVRIVGDAWLGRSVPAWRNASVHLSTPEHQRVGRRDGEDRLLGAPHR